MWSNPPAGEFESATRQNVSVVAATWEPRDGFSSTLLGATAPVLPLEPGPVPVGGTFRADGGASFSFEGSSDPTVPFLNQSIDLRFSGGTFNVPAVFPPTDSEGLYILTEPFTMNGSWTVLEKEKILFSGDLSGAGTAHLVLYGDQRTGNSLISQVFYEFQGSAPVPEPGTLALLGIGGGMLAIRRRRRRILFQWPSAFLQMFPMISWLAAVRRSRAARTLSAVFGIVLLPALASAEPFAITGGHLGFRWNASVDFVGLSGPDFAIPIADSNPEDFGLPGLDIEQADPLAKSFPVSGHMLLSASGPLTRVTAQRTVRRTRRRIA